MTTPTVAVLPGDGIGPEVTAVAVAVAQSALEPTAPARFVTAPFGRTAFDAEGKSFPPATAELVASADAVLLGAVSGPEEYGDPDEPCLLTLRRSIAAFANLRPVRPHPDLVDASPLKPERLVDVDLLFVRELTGGIYFGEKTRTADSASDVCAYTRAEIERVVRRACELAMGRRRKVTLVDKANVMATSRLWRDVSTALVAAEFPGIDFEIVLVDAMTMHLLTRPASFAVIVTENMFGDLLTDEASVLAGSMGLLPSAALGDGRKGLYEPIHGTAPDIAGRGIANPYGAVLSAAMLLRHSLGYVAAAERVERAVDAALRAGVWTGDLGGEATTRDVEAALLDRLRSAVA